MFHFRDLSLVSVTGPCVCVCVYVVGAAETSVVIAAAGVLVVFFSGEILLASADPEAQCIFLRWDTPTCPPAYSHVTPPHLFLHLQVSGVVMIGVGFSSRSTPVAEVTAAAGDTVVNRKSTLHLQIKRPYGMTRLAFLPSEVVWWKTIELV